MNANKLSCLWDVLYPTGQQHPMNIHIFVHKQERTPQNLMTTDPNKLWPEGVVQLKFDALMGELTTLK